MEGEGKGRQEESVEECVRVRVKTECGGEVNF